MGEKESNCNRPNFVVIFPDQWRGDCLGIAGHPVIETPYLDHICTEGIYFPNAYSAAPSCIPARACLATGLNPSNHGRVGYEDCIPWKYKHSLMQQLKDNDYQTLQSGKTHFYPQRLHLGFEEMRLYEIPKYDDGFESDYHIWLERKTNGSVKDIAREVEPNSWAVNPWIYSDSLHNTHWITDSAIELLERRDTTRPFYIQVDYHRPHAPYDPPMHYYEHFLKKEMDMPAMGTWENEKTEIHSLTEWDGKVPDESLNNMRCAYYASIKHVDYEIGRLYHWMKQKKLLDNTYLIFMSDHGELLGDHNMLRKQKPFEGATRIPWIVRLPKGENGNKIIETAVTHMDVLPTILEAAEIKNPYPCDGKSLIKLIKNGEKFSRQYIHGEHSCQNAGWQYLTDGKEKYIWETKTGKEFYFNLVEDRKEENNLINEKAYKEKILYLRQMLIRILSGRPGDGLVSNDHLVHGKILPNYRVL